MKNRLLKCLVLTFFILGFSSSYASDNTTFRVDGGAVGVIIDVGKQASYFFSVPDKYLVNNTLVMPIKISVYDENKNLVYKVESYRTNILLSKMNNLVGSYFISIAIGDYLYIKVITMP